MKKLFQFTISRLSFLNFANYHVTKLYDSNDCDRYRLRRINYRLIAQFKEHEENNPSQMKQLFFLYVWLNLTRILPDSYRDFKENLVKHIRKRTIQTVIFFVFPHIRRNFYDFLRKRNEPRTNRRKQYGNGRSEL